MQITNFLLSSQSGILQGSFNLIKTYVEVVLKFLWFEKTFVKKTRPIE